MNKQLSKYYLISAKAFDRIQSNNTQKKNKTNKQSLTNKNVDVYKKWMEMQQAAYPSTVKKLKRKVFQPYESSSSLQNKTSSEAQTDDKEFIKISSDVKPEIIMPLPLPGSEKLISSTPHTQRQINFSEYRNSPVQYTSDTSGSENESMDVDTFDKAEVKRNISLSDHPGKIKPRVSPVVVQWKPIRGSKRGSNRETGETPHPKIKKKSTSFVTSLRENRSKKAKKQKKMYWIKKTINHF